jgi:ATP-dependent DNA helicase PIF1
MCTLAYSRYVKESSSSASSSSSSASNDADSDSEWASLNADQRQAVNLALAGHSLFLGGAPGTGKSRTIGHLFSRLVGKGRRVTKTATTAAAALSIGAVTLHSWAGVGMAEKSETELAQQLSAQARARWLNTDVLVIDEISMLSGQLFDKLSAIGQLVRGGPLPFGGLQLVLVGDFFQLPPVWTPASRLNQEHLRAQASSTAASSVHVTDRALFAFEAEAWRTAVKHTVELSEVFRQRDAAYLQLLERTRTCSGLPQVCAELDKLKRPIEGPVTKLMAKNADVDLVNMQELSRLPLGTERTYFSHDWVKSGLDAATAKAAKQSLNGEAVLTLRRGAQVLLMSNVGRELVNGSLGVVTGYASEHECQRVEDYGHKDNFVCPVVKFRNGTSLIVCPERKEVTIGPDTVAFRDQVPLRLAWAVTIHRCQGLTLDSVAIDLTSCFEEGQAYVALSRCRTLEGMQVLGYDQGRSFRSSRTVALWTRQRQNNGLAVRLGDFIALRFAGQVSEDTLVEMVSVWAVLFEGIAPFSRFTDREARAVASSQKICGGFPGLRGVSVGDLPSSTGAVCTQIEFIRSDNSIRNTIVLKTT